MKTRSLTLHATLIITLVLVCLIGLGLVLFTDYSYRDLVYKRQQQSNTRLIELKTNALIQELIERQKELGFRLQAEPEFLAALSKGDTEQLRYWLDQEFNRYFVTIGLIKLEKLLVYNLEFNLIVKSASGIDVDDTTNRPCNTSLLSMQQLPLAERIKPRSEICLHENMPVLSTVISIGSLHPKGYLQIITDPAFVIAKIEKQLDMKLRIKTIDDVILHQSSNWPDPISLEDDFIISSYVHTTASNKAALIIESATEIQTFYQQIDSTQTKVLVATVLLVFFAIMFALRILNQALAPLKNLQQATSLISQGKAVTIETGGYPEIAAPVDSFNKMSHRVEQLITDLKQEVNNRKSTEEKLREAVSQSERHAEEADSQRHLSRLTLQSIIDGVITTDVDGRIISMNPVAEYLTGYSEDEARGHHLVKVARLINDRLGKVIYDPLENVEHKSVLDKAVVATLMQHNSHVVTPVEYIAAPLCDREKQFIGTVIIIHDLSVQRALNRQLSFQATHDALTQLINRYEFERIIKSLLHNKEKMQVPHTLCYIDLDQFKVINDTCGHTAGDELLKLVTQLISEHIEDTDILARLGGDEFGVLLNDCDTEQAEKIIKAMLQSIKEHDFTWGEHIFNIGASIGAVELYDNKTTCDELFSRADAACNFAKESGRNRYQTYTVENNKVLTQQREMHWVSRINNALDENRFQLYFQEIMPLGKSNGHFMKHGEILLRMIDKEGDIVSPGTFLPAAERYNMITLIDEWVVANTIEWLAMTEQPVMMSVNLSGKSVSNRDFLNYVVSTIKRHNINPEWLCFEITETAAISHLETAVHFMTVLKKLGCTFALDDFGSGLSSFSYLTSLPVDYLKIDGSFVVDIDKDPMHYAMVKSINEVGQTMGIRTIAEFAASDRIIKCLLEIGVDNAQGYAISRPTPLATINSFGITPTMKVVD